QILPEFLDELKGFLKPDQVAVDGEVRLRHGHGHTQEEMYSIKYTNLGRIPDIVVYPETEEQVTNVVETAKRHGVSLIPYASGTKKNRYGNIEDLVLDVSVVTAAGKLERTSASPRESIGMDLRRLIFGSEGTLGIITSATVKIFPLPEVQEFGSILFPTFEHGFKFMYDLAREGKAPASVRLVDNLQFQFGLALKPKSTSALADLKSKAEK